MLTRLGVRYVHATPWRAKAVKTQRFLPEGWEAVIGIECHAQLRAPTKLFSPTAPPPPHLPPNTRVSPFDAGYPGTLPCLQDGAVTAALKAALALQCTVAPVSVFDRKHYFYADLPTGYQITQHRQPFARDGSVAIRFEDGYLVSPADALDVPIVQLQLEQDTGKSTYAATDAGTHISLVDYNRAGVALVEIVSAPVLRTPEQAGAYVRKLQQLLRCVGASDGNMNEGSLRCDANVSIRRVGEPLGQRTEIKNLNSVKFMMHALEYEIQRQYSELQAGRAVLPSTLGFNEATGETYVLRTKEGTIDYRFMPEPNVGALCVSSERIAALAASLPELPDARYKRLREQYGLSQRDINVLTRLNSDEDAIDGWANAVAYFEELVRLGCAAQTAANWTIHTLPKYLAQAHKAFCENTVPPAALAEVIHLHEDGHITQATAQTLLRLFVQDGVPDHIRAHIDTHRLWRMREDELRPICEHVVRSFPDEVAAVRRGKDKVLMRLVGEAMRATAGRADPAHVTRVLRGLTANSE